jgi:hypothetical protein
MLITMSVDALLDHVMDSIEGLLCKYIDDILVRAK